MMRRKESKSLVGDVVPRRPARPKRTSAATPGASQQLLTLQRSIGNRAVATILQRQGEPLPPAPSPPALLDDAAAASAVAFYRADTARYTTTVITQMQSALHLTPDGVADTALAQAVATFQFANTDEPTLAVDGKAGPRTLPRLFQTGLADAGVAKTFGTDAQHDVIDRWKTLATPAARSSAFSDAINRRFDAVGVPRAAPRLKALNGEDGAFDFPTWTLTLDQTRFSADSLTQAEASALVDVVYHEARHCEQWFRMAQMRAGQHVSAAGIVAEMGIPAAIARQAAANPISRGSVAAAMAQGWFDSVYGSGAEHRNNVLTEVETANRASEAANKAFSANPTDANRGRADRARARFDKAFVAYQNLPEENDAFVAGPRAAAGVTRGTPESTSGSSGAPISGPDTESGGPTPGLATLPEFGDIPTFFANDDVVQPVAAAGSTGATGSPGLTGAPDPTGSAAATGSTGDPGAASATGARGDDLAGAATS